MNEFIFWFRNNQEKIAWFLIGFLVHQGLEEFSKGNLMGAALAWGLALLNYLLNR